MKLPLSPPSSFVWREVPVPSRMAPTFWFPRIFAKLDLTLSMNDDLTEAFGGY